jgi:hypothetical protein
MASKAKCKVEFLEDRFGVDAVLMSGRQSLNLLRLGQHPTAAAKRRARTRLMRGCAELSRGLRKR